MREEIKIPERGWDIVEETKTLAFYSDDHIEIRKFLEPICGPPDDPDRPGYYITTVEQRLSENAVTRHLCRLMSQHNSSLSALVARKELMTMGILDENGRLIDRGLPEDMQPGSQCDF